MKRRRKELKIPKFCLCSSNPVVFASVLAKAVYSRFIKGVVKFYLELVSKFFAKIVF